MDVHSGRSAKLEYDHADWGSHTVAGSGLLYGATPAAISAQQSQFMGTKRFTEESVRVASPITHFLGGTTACSFSHGNAGADLATFNSNVQTTIGNVNSAIQRSFRRKARSVRSSARPGSKPTKPRARNFRARLL